MPQESSISVERWLARLPLPRPAAVALIGVVLLALAVAAALADSALSFLITDQQGRYLLFAPAMIVFLMAIVPSLERSRRAVVRSLRPLVQLDDDAFAAVVGHACRRRPGLEALGLAVGAAFAVLMSRWPYVHPIYPVSAIYVYFANILIFAAIGWCVAIVFEITRLTDELLRQPIRVDILNIEPFESVGRQSLLLAMVFLGGTVLSLFFVVAPSELQGFLNWQNAVIYGVMIALTVIAFFLGMYSTHRLLSSNRREQLTLTQRQVAAAYERLHMAAEASPEALAAATEFNAWTGAKQELRTARTWPYNTEMLRTLVVSGFVPLAVGLVRVLTAWLAVR